MSIMSKTNYDNQQDRQNISPKITITSAGSSHWSISVIFGDIMKISCHQHTFYDGDKYLIVNKI